MSRHWAEVRPAATRAIPKQGFSGSLSAAVPLCDFAYLKPPCSGETVQGRAREVRFAVGTEERLPTAPRTYSVLSQQHKARDP